MPKRASMTCAMKGAPRRVGASILSACLACSLLLAGCVNQHPERLEGEGGSYESRIVATSPAIAEMCNKLDLDLVGVPTTSRGLPERYAEVERVGTAMAPDLERLKSLRPDYVLSPNSLQSDLQPKYASIMEASVFLNLRSVQGLYDSIVYLGEKFDRKKQAQTLVSSYEKFIENYRMQSGDKKAPTVLILMGVPGSYVVATPNSYVGSLVGLAGGVNVYAEANEEFINVNTEDMQARDPDIILRTSHALPAQVMASFAKEFATNDIWKHFRAVQKGQVYDLPSDKFGMSANFGYPDALGDLQVILHGEEKGSDGTVVGEAACVAAAATSTSEDAGAVAEAAASIAGSAGSNAAASIVDKQG